jgi:hypothetical protein
MDRRFNTIGAAADWINKVNHLRDHESVFLDLVRNFSESEQATFVFVNDKYYHIYSDGDRKWGLITIKRYEQKEKRAAAAHH